MPCSPGNRAPQRDAGLHDLPAGRVHALELTRVARIEEDQRVQVAVAGVEHVAMLEPMAPDDLGDLGQGLGQQGPRHGAVVDEVVRGQARHGPERPAAAFPETVARRGVGGLADLATAVGRADFADAAGLIVQPRGGPLHFDDQDRRGVPGIAAGDAVLDRPDDGGIHHLERRRHDPGRDDAGHRAGGVLDGIVDHQLRQHLFGPGHDAHRDLGHHRQRPLAADDERPQVVAGRIVRRSAQVHPLAVGQNRFQAEHVVGRDPVFQAARTARIFTHVAAQRGYLLAGGVRSVEKAQGGERVLQLQVGHTGLDDGSAVLRVDAEDAVQARQADGQPAVRQDRPAGQVGPEAAGHERDAGPGGRFDHLGGFPGVGREHHRAGCALGQRAVVGVKLGSDAGLGHVPVPDDASQFADELPWEHRTPPHRRPVKCACSNSLPGRCINGLGCLEHAAVADDARHLLERRAGAASGSRAYRISRVDVNDNPPRGTRRQVISFDIPGARG